MYEVSFAKNTKRFTEEELLNNIGNLWDILDRQPTTKDLSMKDSIASMGTYFYRFGSWKNAMEKFSLFKNGEITYKDEPYVKRTQRKTISKSIRYDIFNRDNFKCVLCGASPATSSTTLEIDHIVPISKGGSNDIHNLQTLCKDCNIGKFSKVENDNK